MGRPAPWFVALGVASLVSVLGACGGGDSVAGPERPDGGTAQVGSLALSISGLPAGASAAVTVTASGLPRTVTASGTLRDLAPGTYTVTAANVTVASQIYVPDPATQQVSVAAGTSAASASVTYVTQVTTGSIRLTLDGLPAGAYGQYTVRNSAGTAVRSGAVAQGAVEVEAALTPGAHTVTWADLTLTDANYDDRTYKPVHPSQPLNVEASVAPVDASVVYAIGTGEIALTVSGLPTGERAGWTLRNSAGVAIRWGSVLEGATVPVTNLVPGSYALTWDDAGIQDANLNTRTYVPNLPARTLTVPASLTPVADSVSYALATGAIALSVEGLPADQRGRYRIHNSAGDIVSVDRVRQGAMTQVTNLVPGTYFLTWDNESVADVGGNWHTYAPTPASRTLTVTAGMTPVDGGTTYSIATGVLALSVTGLPDGATGHYTIRDGGGDLKSSGSVRQGATRHVSELAPGSYSVSWSDSGNATPSPRTTTVTVTATLTPVAVNVTYSAP